MSQGILCSVNRTFRLKGFTICWECVNDWRTVYGFTRKVLALSVFILIATAMSPLFIAGQSNTALEQRVEDMNHRLNTLETLPEDVASMRVEILGVKADIQGIKTDQKDVAAWVRSGIIAILGAFALRFLDAFGIGLKVRKREEG